MRIVAVDIGNTRGHIATFELQHGDHPRLKTSAALSHAMIGSPSLYHDARLAKAAFAYSSVHPAVEARFTHAVLRATGRTPAQLGHDFPPAIRNRYRPPAAAGLDRLANAAAAWARARAACVVVDLGTAVTFDVVNARGEFIGGMIAPGLAMQVRALREHTALLPEVTPRRTRRAVGRTTEDAIQAGVSFGLEGLIRTGLAAIRREVGGRARAIGTGGDAPLYRDLFDEVVPALTLEGIAVSYALSR
ncbi:MAG: type III pantothenate kinase [Planctomycetes bacterium]|nr:type III pantothenate kinase [Planctomycetota bacterium]